MSITAAEFARMRPGMAVGGARMRLERMTALGVAERRVYNDRATTFTLLDVAAPEPVRIKVGGGCQLEQQAMRQKDAVADLRRRVHEFLKTGSKSIAEVRAKFGLRSVQSTRHHLIALKRDRLAGFEKIGPLQQWQAL